jgi:hypothetical protein
MQAFKPPIRQLALRQKVCPVSSYSPTITLRTFSIGPVWNKQSRTLETPEPAVSKDHTLPKNSESVNDSKLAKHIEEPGVRRLRKREYMRKYMKTRYATDPIWRDEQLAARSAYETARLASDPEYRARQKEYHNQFYQARRKNDPHFAISLVIRSWVYRSPSTMRKLSWKAHVPVLTTEKVEHYCTSCQVKRRNGLKLWWQRKSNSGNDEPLYDCNSCFFTNTAITLPKGFEDVKTVQQLYLRRQQLLGISAKLRKNASPSSSPGT